MSGSRPTIEELRQMASPVRPVFVKVTLRTDVLVLAEDKQSADKASLEPEPESWRTSYSTLMTDADVLQDPTWRTVEPEITPRVQTAYGDLAGKSAADIIEALKAEKPDRCPHTLDLFDDFAGTAHAGPDTNGIGVAGLLPGHASVPSSVQEQE